MPTTYERILDMVTTLSAAEVRRLRTALNELAEHGYLPVAPGSVTFKLIKRASGKVDGPYKYRRTWENGKLVDHYEGRATDEEYAAWLARKAERKGKITLDDENFGNAMTGYDHDVADDDFFNDPSLHAKTR